MARQNSLFVGRHRTASPQSWRKLAEMPDGMVVNATPMPGRTYTKDTYPPRGRGRGESLTSPRRIAAKLRAAQVIRLRIEGYTLASVARKLGFRDASGAYRAMRRTMDRLDWDELRRKELGMRSVYDTMDFRLRSALCELEREIETHCA
jgi:hypothetical protein